MRSLLLVLLVACSSSSSTPKTEPVPSGSGSAPPAPAVMTKEECEAAGGRVNSSIGGGDQKHCNDDETEVAAVRLGIEGGWCCQKKQ